MSPDKLAKLEAWMRKRQAKTNRQREFLRTLHVAEPLPPITAPPGVQRHPNSLIVALAREFEARIREVRL